MSKHLGLIGVFVQQNNRHTNAPRVQASGSHSFIYIRLIKCQNATKHKKNKHDKVKIVAKLRRYSKAGTECK